MFYEARDLSRPGGQSSFQLELDEPPDEGAFFAQLNMVYEVVRVLPAETVIEVTWRAGPVEAWYG